jgi:hypothetical protein
MRKIVYLAGPMTGFPEFNYPAFHEAARRLREVGLAVINPAENGLPSDAPWEQHMRKNIADLMMAEAVVVLPGWQNSRGARLETEIAGRLAMPVIELDHAVIVGRMNRMNDDGGRNERGNFNCPVCGFNRNSKEHRRKRCRMPDGTAIAGRASA